LPVGFYQQVKTTKQQPTDKNYKATAQHNKVVPAATLAIKDRYQKVKTRQRSLIAASTK
jgi:hypothetical protein